MKKGYEWSYRYGTWIKTASQSDGGRVPAKGAGATVVAADELRLVPTSSKKESEGPISQVD